LEVIGAQCDEIRHRIGGYELESDIFEESEVKGINWKKFRNRGIETIIASELEGRMRENRTEF
jgi:hypothetical protein